MRVESRKGRSSSRTRSAVCSPSVVAESASTISLSPRPWRIVAAAVVYSFVFNNTGRSTLAAIIFHFMSNMTVELTNVTDATNLYATLLWIAAAVAVASLWGAGAVTPPSASASATR